MIEPRKDFIRAVGRFARRYPRGFLWGSAGYLAAVSIAATAYEIGAAKSTSILIASLGVLFNTLGAGKIILNDWAQDQNKKPDQRGADTVRAVNTALQQGLAGHDEAIITAMKEKAALGDNPRLN